MKKILNIEDNILKHTDVRRALEFNGLSNIEHAKNAEDGISKIINSMNEKNPYDILVLDMHFPVKGEYDNEAGIYVIKELQKIDCKIPIIICSSLRLNISEAVSCIFYNKSRDLNMDMKEALEKIK